MFYALLPATTQIEASASMTCLPATMLSRLGLLSLTSPWRRIPRNAPVNNQLLACNMSRRGTRQETHAVRHVMAITHLRAQRHAGIPFLHQPLIVPIIILICQDMHQRRVDQAWHHDVQSDVLRRVHQCGGFGELDHGGLCGGVGDLRLANVTQGCDGGEVDDAAGCARGGGVGLGLVFHDGQDVVRGEVDGFEVYVRLRVPGRFGHCGGRAGLREADVAVVEKREFSYVIQVTGGGGRSK